MARQFSSCLFKQSMIKIELISVFILGTFFLSVLVIGFFNIQYFRKITTVQRAIIHSLANLSEWRDPETGSHLERTRNFSVLLAKTLRKRSRYRKVITDDFIEALYDAVPLHDIGKVGIRDEILLKSSHLEPEELEIMKKHVMIGQDIIQNVIDRFGLESKFLIFSRNLCSCHHEKFDGSGYPEGLSGDAIPFEARIFAICDVYDALGAKRPYKRGLSHMETIEIILPESGKHFDPDVVDAFKECSDRFYEIFEAYKLFDDTYGKLMNVRGKDALKVAWTVDMSIGEATIDAQHKEFITRANALFAGILLGEGKKETLREIDFLRDYAVYHFASEEALMERYEFPDLPVHKSEHELFLRNLQDIKGNARSDSDVSSALVVSVNSKVISWLVTHMIMSDRKFGEYIKSSHCSTL